MNGKPRIRSPRGWCVRYAAPSERWAGLLLSIAHNAGVGYNKKKSLLSIQNISMRFGAKVLFEDVTCTFLAGRRYAITGPNGAGKSTLMKILTGELEARKRDHHTAEEVRRAAPGPVRVRRIPRD